MRDGRVASEDFFDMKSMLDQLQEANNVDDYAPGTL